MNLSEKLIKLRVELGLSQYEVAERLGISRSRYNSWERDTKPRPDMILKLADFYSVSPNFLYDYQEASNTEELPEWATKKDIADFKKMLENDQPVMFDGVPIEGEKRQRVMDILSGLFWEAKEMNKETYGKRKSSKNSPSEDNKE